MLVDVRVSHLPSRSQEILTKHLEVLRSGDTAATPPCMLGEQEAVSVSNTKHSLAFIGTLRE